MVPARWCDGVGAAMNILGRLFGADKAVDNLLDKDSGLLAKAGAWVGNLNLTEEEQIKHNHMIREWGISQLQALAPFKIMQRIMVSIIVTEWAILFNVIIIAICLKADTILENLVEFSCSQYAWYPMGAAVTLYLLGGVWKRKE